MENTINVVSLRMVVDKEVRHSFHKSYVRSPEDTVDIVNEAFDLTHQPREMAVVLSLDMKNQINGLHVLSIGTIGASIVNPRELFQYLLSTNAASFILFHNHPSGKTEPSNADIEITHRIEKCSELMGIHFLDHIIVGDGEFTSLKIKGYL